MTAATTTATSTAAVAAHAASLSGGAISEAEAAAVNLGAGITNFFDNIGSQLVAVAKTVKAGVTSTTSGATLPSVTTGGANVLTQIEGAASALGKLVTDAKAKNIGASVQDAVALTTAGMATLSTFGISVPGLSTFTSLLTEVAAFV